MAVKTWWIYRQLAAVTGGHGVTGIYAAQAGQFEHPWDPGSVRKWCWLTGQSCGLCWRTVEQMNLKTQPSRTTLQGKRTKVASWSSCCMTFSNWWEILSAGACQATSKEQNIKQFENCWGRRDKNKHKGLILILILGKKNPFVASCLARCLCILVTWRSPGSGQMDPSTHSSPLCLLGAALCPDVGGLLGFYFAGCPRLLVSMLRSTITAAPPYHPQTGGAGGLGQTPSPAEQVRVWGKSWCCYWERI